MNKLKPAIIAGGALGLLLLLTEVVAALPVLRLAGCCDCVWPVAAGLLATMLYIKGAPTPASVGDGALVGALAGLIGGIIYLVVGVPISYLMGRFDLMDAQLRQLSPNFPLTGVALVLIAGAVAFILFIVLGTIGGLVAVPIFEKRKGSQAPPPPPSEFGGPGGGFGSAA